MVNVVNHHFFYIVGGFMMYTAQKEFVALMDKFKKLRSIEKIINSELSFAEMVVLENVTQINDKVTVSKLAEEMKVTKAASSKIVTSLEKKGFVERITDSNDKRFSYILLTTKGEAVVAKTYCSMENLSKRIAEKMGEEDMSTLVRLMNKLYLILEDGKKEGKKDV